MVKLDNWETKAEKAAVRRVEAKKRKQQRDQTRNHKAMAKQLLSFLDSLPEERLNDTEIHVWTEQLSANTDLCAEKGNTSTSTNDCHKPPASPKKSKSRSKFHREAEGSSEICTEYFFHGCCCGPILKSPVASKKKKRKDSFLGLLENQSCSGGLHPQNLYKDGAPYSKSLEDRRNSSKNFTTLYQVLHSKKHEHVHVTGENRSTIEASKGAAEACYNSESGTAKDPSDSSWTFSMNPVQHCVLSVLRNGVTNKHTRRISDFIVSVLNDDHHAVGSIVYVVVKGILIFDRHRRGLVVSKAEEEWLRHGQQGSKRRSISVGQDPTSIGDVSTENIEQYHQHLVALLPAPVLEYIILFLEDQSAGRLPLVCKNWQQEIGKKSPHLWKQLCNRHRWPIDADLVEPEAFRENFVSHFSTTTLSKSIASVLRSVGESNYTQHAGCPEVALTTEFDVGDFIKAWSLGRVLIARKEDCLLDLYEAVTTRVATANLKRVIHQQIPFPSQRRHELVHLDLDDQCIGCICKDIGRSRYYLCCIPKESLLQCAGCKSPKELNHTDVSGFNLSILIGDYVCEHLTKEIVDSINAERLIDCHVVSMSKFRACGNGLFLLGVILKLGISEVTESASEEDNACVEKLFLFCASSGSITWASNLTERWTRGTEIATGFWRMNQQCPEDENVFETCKLTLYRPHQGHLQSLGIKFNGSVTLHEQHQMLSLTTPEEHCCQVIGSLNETVIAYTNADKTVLSFPGDSKSQEMSGKLLSFAVFKSRYILLLLSSGEDKSVSLQLFHVPSRIILSNYEIGDIPGSILFSAGDSSVAGLVEDSCAFLVSQVGNEVVPKLTLSTKEKGKGTRHKKKTSKRKSNSGVDGYARGMRMN